jgi:hypothetical protein
MGWVKSTSRAMPDFPSGYALALFHNMYSTPRRHRGLRGAGRARLRRHLLLADTRHFHGNNTGRDRNDALA